MSSTDPKISVVMTVYKGNEYFPKAVQSILGQTMKDIELVIVMDPCPGYRSMDMIEDATDHRIRIIENQDREGLVRSRNIGVKSSRGKYIAVLDSDDISQPDRLEKEYSFLEKNPDHSLVGSSCDVIDGSGKVIKGDHGPWSEEEIYYSIHFSNQLPHSSIMARRSDIISVGAYDERYGIGEDYKLYLKLMDKGRVFKFDEPLIKWRSHSGSVTGSLSVDIEDHLLQMISEWYRKRYGLEVSDEQIRMFRDHSRTSISINGALDSLRALRSLNDAIIKEAPEHMDVKVIRRAAKHKMMELMTGQLVNRRLPGSLKILADNPTLLPSLIKHIIGRIAARMRG
ncbi:MAG: glycosyltransferase [Thermoplasmatota archaeon]